MHMQPLQQIALTLLLKWFEISCIFISKSGSEKEYVIKICNEYICGMKLFCHNIHLIKNLCLLHEYFSSIIWQTGSRHKCLSCQQLLNINQNNCI